MELFMKSLTAAVVLFATLGTTFVVHAQAAKAPTPKTAPTLSAEQRRTEKAAAQARFAAMSPQEKAANKGNKQKPSKPAAPSKPQSRK
jgi:hypothetical protein